MLWKAGTKGILYMAKYEHLLLLLVTMIVLQLEVLSITSYTTKCCIRLVFKYMYRDPKAVNSDIFISEIFVVHNGGVRLEFGIIGQLLVSETRQHCCTLLLYNLYYFAMRPFSAALSHVFF